MDQMKTFEAQMLESIAWMNYIFVEFKNKEKTIN